MDPKYPPQYPYPGQPPHPHPQPHEQPPPSQQAPYSHPAPYSQPAPYAQPAPYSQPAPYAQPAPYSQPQMPAHPHAPPPPHSQPQVHAYQPAPHSQPQMPAPPPSSQRHVGHGAPPPAPHSQPQLGHAPPPPAPHSQPHVGYGAPPPAPHSQPHVGYGAPPAPYSQPQPHGYPPSAPAPYSQPQMPAHHAPAPYTSPTYQQPQAPVEAPFIRLNKVTKSYSRGNQALTILKGIDLDLQQGAYEALMGPSGSGKSTLLNLIAGLDQPSTGSIDIGGSRLDQMSEDELAKWRSETVGFIFQAYNLVPVLTAVENVELPLLLTKLNASERKRRAQVALRVVGLEERMDHYPKMLSGGQEQRVAIARAIVNDPALIVADEPTGDLDREMADEILLLLEKLNVELGKTIVMVTHDPAAAERAHRVRRLNKGVLE